MSSDAGPHKIGGFRQAARSAPQTDEDMAAVVNTGNRPCLEIYGVAWKRSLLSSDRRRMVCEYDAADAEGVTHGPTRGEGKLRPDLGGRGDRVDRGRGNRRDLYRSGGGYLTRRNLAVQPVGKEEPA